MKIFRLGDFTDETMHQFIEFSNNYWEYPWTISVDSPGGEYWVKGELDHFLNKKFKEQGNVEIVVSLACSAAMLFILETPIPVHLVFGARGMAHLSGSMAMIASNNKPFPCTGNLNEVLERDRKLFSKHGTSLLKDKLTAEEFSMYSKGEDVYFDYNRLKKIIHGK